MLISVTTKTPEYPEPVEPYQKYHPGPSRHGAQ